MQGMKAEGQGHRAARFGVEGLRFLGLPCAPNSLAVHLEKKWLARWRSHQATAICGVFL